MAGCFGCLTKDYALLLTMHHIVSDGWSLGVLRKELSVLYGSYMHGEKDPLPTGDSVCRLRGVAAAVDGRRGAAAAGGVLEEYIEGSTGTLELQTDYVRPVQQDYAGEYIGVVVEEL